MTKRKGATSVETTIADGRAATTDCSLASAIKAEWEAGRPPDACAALAAHPELAENKFIVLDLAYEEFCRREELGEQIDVERFCERFAEHGTSVYRRLQVHQYVERELSGPESETRWPTVPQEFCGFELLEEIGRGAIGRVYLARQAALGDRSVVLKVSKSGSREAHLLGRLQHSNVVPVYSVDYDDESGLTCVCMPLLGLATFEDLLKQIADSPARPRSGAVFSEAIFRKMGGPPAAAADGCALVHRMSFVDALLFQFAQVAEALAYLHDKEISHRDLKPSNILLTDDARPVLLDFNLSAELDASDGRLGGTLPYMAPEQIRAMLGGPTDNLDARADVFSMGVIFYQLLTGALPFGPVSTNLSLERAGNLLLEKQTRGADLARLREIGVDRAVIALVGRCLAIQPDDRFETADAAAAAIRHALRPPARARRWMRAHRLRTAAIIVALVSVLCISGAWLALRKPVHERLYIEGRAAIERGELPEAVELLQQAIQAQPEFTPALHALARAQLALGEHHAASLHYEDLHELTGEPRFLASVGYCNNLMGDHRKAIESYSRAIKGGYRNELVLNNLGYSHQKQGNLPTARQQFEAALRINPDYRPSLQNRAFLEWDWAMLRRTRVRENATTDIESAIRLAPETGKLHFIAACIWCLSDAKNRDERVLDHVERAINLGIKPEQFKQGNVFDSLRQDYRMMRLLDRPPHKAPALAAEPPAILDPDSPQEHSL
jgi:serine/threonine protein kinase/Tfp pilus assembly protein PilF